MHYGFFLLLLLLWHIIWDYLRCLMFLGIYFIFQNKCFSCYKSVILQQGFQYFKEHFLPIRHMQVKTEVQFRCGISHEPMEAHFVVTILSQMEVLHLFIHQDQLKRCIYCTQVSLLLKWGIFISSVHLNKCIS